VAVVVTVAKGYDLDYIWKTQGQSRAERTSGGYYIDAAQAGEPPGRWWGPGAETLGFGAGQIVERKPYDAVYQQIDPHTGSKLGRPRGRYAKFADHLARLKAAEPQATAERLIELEREAAQATRHGIRVDGQEPGRFEEAGLIVTSWLQGTGTVTPKTTFATRSPGSPGPPATESGGRMTRRACARSSARCRRWRPPRWSVN